LAFHTVLKLPVNIFTSSYRPLLFSAYYSSSMRYVASDSSATIYSGLLKEDANVLTGLIPHSAKIGATLCGRN
jgi:hypothetical protein